MVYRWRPGVKVGADAQDVGMELELIEQQHKGRFGPRQVLEYARDPSTALHECFDWDDAHAAERYRLKQAQVVVRSIQVEVSPAAAAAPLVVAAYEGQRTDRGGTVFVSADPDRDDVAADAARQVRMHLRKALDKMRECEQLGAGFSKQQQRALEAILGELQRSKTKTTAAA